MQGFAARASFFRDYERTARCERGWLRSICRLAWRETSAAGLDAPFGVRIRARHSLAARHAFALISDGREMVAPVAAAARLLTIS
jgi:hypothetical protein